MKMAILNNFISYIENIAKTGNMYYQVVFENITVFYSLKNIDKLKIRCLMLSTEADPSFLPETNRGKSLVYNRSLTICIALAANSISFYQVVKHAILIWVCISE